MIISRDLQQRAEAAARAVTTRSSTMEAWCVREPGPIASGPLVRVERARPEPGPGQVVIGVTACGVCRTDLHLAEGDLPPRRPDVVPGHEVVGYVAQLGPDVDGLQVGDRVGVPWLGGTDGTCRFCRRGSENLCTSPTFTGWDVDGGYAEACVANAGFVYRLPSEVDDTHAAPLLCSGVIGYRALRLSGVRPGGRLGLYGFGASAHLTAQVALHLGMRVHVLTRGAGNQDLARRLGVDSVGDATGQPPEPLDGAILFAPVGSLVPVAMRALDRGGTLAVAGIWVSPLPPLDYAADLFEERQLRTVTANTREDGEELLRLAGRYGVRPETTVYPMADAPTALSDLAAGRFSGAAVLQA
jgi:propanol-preferring alcohol dehydrogenase